MDIASALIWLGIAITGAGAVLRFAPRLLSWFGHLPGDIRYEGENSFVFIPLASMLVVSVVLTLVRALFRQ